MSRVSLALAVAALVLLATVSPAAALVAPSISRAVTLTGTIQVTDTFASAEYELDGYLLVHKDPKYLVQFIGIDVVVVGTEITGPTIYMRKAIDVQSITPKSDGSDIVILPVLPTPPSLPSKPPEDVVILPVLPTPEPEPEQVTIPALPAPPTAPKAEPAPVGPPNPPQITVQLHGQPVAMDQAPILSNSRTLVGLRAISEAMGATVSWDQESFTATVTLNDRTVTVQVGSSQVTVQQKDELPTVILTDTAPVITGGRTMIPVRVLAESLGLTVGWDANTWTVTLD